MWADGGMYETTLCVIACRALRDHDMISPLRPCGPFGPPPPPGHCFNFHSGRGRGDPLDPLPPSPLRSSSLEN